VQPDAEHLVQLDVVAVEAEPRACHVQPPDPGGALADLLDRLAPVRVQVRAPGRQGPGVVLAQVLLVADLEAGVVHERDQVAGSLQLAVGEDVPVDEPGLADGGPGVVGPGDAVVEEPAAGVQLAEQVCEVGREVVLAHVFGQPDRADRVEARLEHVAVVQVAHLGEPGQPFPLDGGLGPGGLLGGQRDAERLDAVLPCGVHHHAAPAAADVEQPHPLLESELAGDQVELVDLRLFQGGVRARVTGAGVGHRRPEHPLVEAVGHVVVVRDRAGVTALGVQPAAGPPAVRADLLGWRRHPVQQQLRAAEGAQQAQLLRGTHADRLRLGQPGQRLVHVAVDVQVPGHVGAGQPERARRLGQVGHGGRRADGDLQPGSWCAGVAAVVGRELDRGVGARDCLEDLS
jgi:hypothetical protein